MLFVAMGRRKGKSRLGVAFTVTGYMSFDGMHLAATKSGEQLNSRTLWGRHSKDRGDGNVT
jgi:hypothetical protein